MKRKGTLVHLHRYNTRLQARLMVSIPENIGVEVEDHVDSDDDVITMLNPEQLAQENQALKDKMGTMEAQMVEMMSMLQALKNGATTEATTVADPSGPTSAIPPPGSGVPPFSHSPGANGQSRPNVQAYPWGMPFNYVPQIAESNPSGVVGASQPAGVVSNGAAGGPRVPVPTPGVVL